LSNVKLSSKQLIQNFIGQNMLWTYGLTAVYLIIVPAQ